MTGLYIHVPFCVKKCSYCDFYSLPQRIDSLPDYVEAVLTEAQAYAGLCFETVYFGGGTPSLLGPFQLGRLVSGLRQVFDLSKVVEFTVEANPDSLGVAFLEAAKAAGVNRLSIGVQSLCDVELQSVGRVHTAPQALSAIKFASQTGFGNVSCDVILGLPGQTWESLRTTLETLVGSVIQHVSVYCLSLEPHTLLGMHPPFDLPDEDAQATLYDNTCRLLAQSGFVHYEISNFALPGFECRHNLNYWRGGEYLGLGPAAASHLNGRRFKNEADLDAYLQNPTAAKSESEQLPAAAKASEEAMLRLRLLEEGLDWAEIECRFGHTLLAGLRQRLDGLLERGLLSKQGDHYRLPAGCALVSNSILLEVLED